VAFFTSSLWMSSWKTHPSALASLSQKLTGLFCRTGSTA